MKVIVGLGNPGAKYRGTRHNIGFAVVDELARRWAVEFDTAPVEALVAKWRPVGAEPVLPVKVPLTFMNASGEATGAMARYFKLDIGDLLIVVDEVQLPLGKLRARARGSAGGHNGLKSIIAHSLANTSSRGCGLAWDAAWRAPAISPTMRALPLRACVRSRPSIG